MGSFCSRRRVDAHDEKEKKRSGVQQGARGGGGGQGAREHFVPPRAASGDHRYLGERNLDVLQSSERRYPGAGDRRNSGGQLERLSSNTSERRSSHDSGYSRLDSKQHLAKPSRDDAQYAAAESQHSAEPNKASATLRQRPVPASRLEAATKRWSAWVSDEESDERRKNAGKERRPSKESDDSDAARPPPAIASRALHAAEDSASDEDDGPARAPWNYVCTTVMLRNIPNKYTQDRLVDQLMKSFKGKFDFLYMPIDFKNRCNVGYGFINFGTPEYCAEFASQFDGVEVSKCLPGRIHCKKVAEVTPARVQGFEENVRRLRCAPVMEELVHHPLWMPMVFDEKGEKRPFPVADINEIKRRTNRDGAQPPSTGAWGAHRRQENNPAGGGYEKGGHDRRPQGDRDSNRQYERRSDHDRGQGQHENAPRYDGNDSRPRYNNREGGQIGKGDRKGRIPAGKGY